MAEIKIDMDKKCADCGEPGVVASGYCMQCLLKPVIGDKTAGTIHKQVQELIDTYTEKIDKAIKMNGNELVVNFAVNLTASKNRHVAVKTTISFTAEKIKFSSETEAVEELQGEMFGEER